MQMRVALLSRPFLVCLALAPLFPGCSSGGGGSDDDDGPDPIEDNVSLLTGANALLLVTGEGSTNIISQFTLANGQALLNDAVSSSLLLLSAQGVPSLFTAAEDLLALSPQALVQLGPLTEILFGTGIGEVYAADDESGLLFRMGVDGTPAVHATKEMIQQVTTRADSKISLPRFLTNNQLIAQELFGNDLLLFSTSTTPQVQIFVTANELADRAGVPELLAVVTGWARSEVPNSDLFARFSAGNNIVKVRLNRTVAVHMLGTDLDLLFPEVEELHIVDFVADTISDVLLVIIGERVNGVSRGIAVAIVTDDGAVGVFSSEEVLAGALGVDYDLFDIGVLTDGVPYAIDRGAAQVLTFNSTGDPVVVGETGDIAEESGSQNPDISIATPVGDENDVRGIVVPEADSGNLLLVE